MTVSGAKFFFNIFSGKNNIFTRYILNRFAPILNFLKKFVFEAEYLDQSTDFNIFY